MPVIDANADAGTDAARFTLPFMNLSFPEFMNHHGDPFPQVPMWPKRSDSGFLGLTDAVLTSQRVADSIIS